MAILYLSVDRSKNHDKHFLALLLLVLCLLFAIGYFSWEPEHEISQTGSGLLFSSSVWFSGLLMVLTVKSKKLGAWVFPVSIALSVCSLFSCFALLLVTGQIWGL